MTSECNSHAVARPRRTGAGWIVRAVHAALTRQRTRRALRRLDARLLSDVGLRETEAAAEARRKLWDAPDHWRSL